MLKNQLVCRQKNIKFCFSYLVVVLEGLGLVSLAIMQLSQFSQYLGVGGSYTDHLHQPLDCLLGIFQKLIDGASESRTKICSHGNGQRCRFEALNKHFSNNKSQFLSVGYRLASWYMTWALFLRMAWSFRKQSRASSRRFSLL